MKPTLPVLLLSGCALALGLVASASQDLSAAPLGDGAVQVLPFGLMDSVRRTDMTVRMKVQLYNSGTSPVALERLDVRTASGDPLASVDLHGERMTGDSGAVEGIYRKMEMVDPELSHRHSPRLYIPLDQRPKLDQDVEAAYFLDIIAGVRNLKLTGAPQLRNVEFPVDLHALLAGARPGDENDIDVVLTYRDRQGTERSARLTHTVTLLPEYMPPPAEWYAAMGKGRAAGAWHAGDLHVHNCRDEAINGCPSCAAESVNITGSFTNANLKNQYLALGMDFYSTTTHSYCINSDTEFNAVKNEAATLDDAAFVLICGTEISGRETGRQWGSDGADYMCYLGFGSPVHHMGAHGITSRKPGGKDGFLDFCDDPLYSQLNNVPAVNQEGGFTVANHPNASLWAFNSVDGFRGMPSNKTLGTEIWNGAVGQPEAEHVWWWKQRMLEGRFTLPLSGSDTHDQAFDFGAVHTWVDAPYTDARLRAAIMAGRNYLSNGPFLDIELRDSAGRSALGGALVKVKGSKIPPGYPVDMEVFYNTPQSATLRVWKGSVGASDEVLVQEFTGVTGSGSVIVPTTVEPTASSWYRADIDYDIGPGTAWTMPVMILLY